MQMDALKRTKCARIYQEKISTAKAERPELMQLLDNAFKGDVIIVWKADTSSISQSKPRLGNTAGGR